MGELLVNDKEIVVPGQVIAKGLDFLPSYGTYRLNENIIANRVGLLSVEGKVLKTIPLSGRYLPQRNDMIIGKVEDILMSGWRFDINAPYSAVLPLKDASFDFIAKGVDLSKYFNIDDYAVVKVTNVTSQNLIDLTAKGPGLKRLRGGMILKANSQKVPRIIGKKGTMVSLIKRATDCKIIVGQNGIIWLDGEPEMEVIAIAAIKKVEEESHLQGVTESVKKFLEEKTGKQIADEIEPSDDNDHSSDFDDSQFERPEMNDEENQGENSGEHRPHNNENGENSTENFNKGNFQRTNGYNHQSNGGGYGGNNQGGGRFRNQNDRR
ncbi:MAG: exosome complex RNA-binding protein Rrp4 [Candidatus Woesearchaeota archaeon]|jgi:exosome complex component RRP4